MKASLLFACSALGLGLAAATQDAPETTDNPVGVVFKAQLPDRDGVSIRGSVSATAHSSGRGVVFTYNIDGFDPEDGPFREYILSSSALTSQNTQTRETY